MLYRDPQCFREGVGALPEGHNRTQRVQNSCRQVGSEERREGEVGEMAMTLMRPEVPEGEHTACIRTPRGRVTGQVRK